MLPLAQFYCTSPVLLTFNTLLFFYENPVLGSWVTKCIWPTGAQRPPLYLATNDYVFDIILTLKENIMLLHRLNIAIIKLQVTIYFVL